MQHKGGKDHKKWKYGGKQMHGTSRAAYFASRKLWRAAANKARRLAKTKRLAEKKAVRKLALTLAGSLSRNPPVFLQLIFAIL